MNVTSPVRTLLLSRAADPADPATLALAGLLATALERHAGQLPLAGLDAAATQALMARWFAGADEALVLDWAALAQAEPHEPRLDEVTDLLALLGEHADPELWRSGAARDVAHAIGVASLGDNHLWQDMLLPSRRELSAIFERWFGSLAALNTHNMKWKKFLYKQLCVREDIMICKAPSCGVCTDQALCFGPELATVSMPVSPAPPPA